MPINQLKIKRNDHDWHNASLAPTAILVFHRPDTWIQWVVDDDPTGKEDKELMIMTYHHGDFHPCAEFDKPVWIRIPEPEGETYPLGMEEEELEFQLVMK